MRILRTPDREWRAEQHRDGWRLYRWDFLVLTKATLDQLAGYMLDAGADPEDLDIR